MTCGDVSHSTGTYENVSRRYTGQILDEDTGLYYYNARYYDAQLARFTQADSEFATGAPDSQGLNRYAYCANNPLIYTDPSGNFIAELAIAAAVGAILGGAQAAVYGGNVWQGAAFGALSGALGYVGGVGGFSLAVDGLGWGAKSLGTAMLVGAGSAAAGALSAVITGGDPVIAAATAGASAGIGFRLGFSFDALGGNTAKLTERYLYELAASTALGAGIGGIVAEIQGGNFWAGAGHAAIWSAAGYVVSSLLNHDAGDESGESWFERAAKKVADGVVDAAKTVGKAAAITGDCLWTGVKCGVLHDDYTISHTEFGKTGSTVGYVGEAAWAVVTVAGAARTAARVGAKFATKRAIRSAGDDAVEWLGKGAKHAVNRHGDDFFLSGDRARRMDFHFKHTYPHQSPHIHLAEKIGGKWYKTPLLYPKNVPPH